jgi:hypothetical protein
MSDEQFLAQFAAGTLPPQQFNHLGHVRLAWLHLQRYDFDEAVRRTCDGIRAYATHLGAANKFHWTITEALMHLLHAAGASEPGTRWVDVVAANKALLTDARARLAQHYSDSLLASAAARTRFVAPDLAPL